MSEPLLEVSDLRVEYATRGPMLPWNRKPPVVAVDGVSLRINRGETLGLIGESGSGKTTTGSAILRRVDAARGTVRFDGRDITQSRGQELRELRRSMQLVFQDPYSSLNPRMRVIDSIAEPLIAHKITSDPRELRTIIEQRLALVGLAPDAADRFPHQFSGGQRQRIVIARALALDPTFLVLDEPVSALDTSVQATIMNLLKDLQQQREMTFLFIAHDLAVVRHISDRIAIMYAGQIVETAPRDLIYDSPAHPYTMSLLSAVPVVKPGLPRRERIVLKGDAPDPSNPPTGCRFHSRCPFKRSTRCDTEQPELREIAPDQFAACHWIEDIRAQALDVGERSPVPTVDISATASNSEDPLNAGN